MEENRKILIVDDDPGILDSYRNILAPPDKEDMLSEGEAIFGETENRTGPVETVRYQLTVTERGEQGVAAVETAVREKQPFAAAFIDMKMPGMDGAETAKRIWRIDPEMKIVIVTAYSEYSPESIIRVTGRSDIFYLRKPFNPDEIRQFARTLSKEWNLERERDRLSHELEKANDQLEDMNRNLRERVEEQTVLLVQAEKMATIGILAAGIAHEINNPMTFINGNLTAVKKYGAKISDLISKYRSLEDRIRAGKTSDLLQTLEDIRRFNEEQKIDFVLTDLNDLADESLDGVDRVRNIVNDLNTFSRIEQADYKYININNAIDTTLNILSNEIKHQAEVIKDYGELPEIKCFSQKLCQAFMNILMNAAQAMESKGTIRIETRYVKEGRRSKDERVVIKIADTGKGIPQDVIPKIFDPFFTTKPVGQGTGLGLSITYDIIKAHGGEIRIQSKEGEGALFTISLPAEPAVSKQPATGKEEPSPMGFSKGAGYDKQHERNTGCGR